MENKNIPFEIRKLADFANSAYKKTPEERFKAVAMYNGWEYSRDLSNDYTAVWVGDNVIIMANRGTVVTDGNDLLADLSVAGGTPQSFLKSARFKVANQTFLRIREKYPNYSILLTGHSLGGSVDNSIYSRYEDSIQSFYNYNPGSGVSAGIGNMIDQIFKRRNEKAFNNYIKGDPISAISINKHDPNTKIIQPKPGVFAHSLSNFISDPVKKERMKTSGF